MIISDVYQSSYSIILYELGEQSDHRVEAVQSDDFVEEHEDEREPTGVDYWSDSF